MIQHVRDSLRGDAVLIGSSLGGLTAARVAERDDRVKARAPLAPAFRLVHRWQQQLGAEWDEWKRNGWREVFDYSKGGPSKISFEFFEDALELSTDLPNVMTHSLIMLGSRDETVLIEYSRELLKRHPDTATLIELDDGHQLLESLPRLLAETDRFLAPYLRS